MDPLANQYDTVIKNEKKYDFIVSNSDHMRTKPVEVPSVFNRGNYYVMSAKDARKSMIHEGVKFQDLTPVSTLTNLISSNGGFAEWKFTAIKGLYSHAFILMTITNNNSTNTATLFSTPLWFNRIVLNFGGSQVDNMPPGDYTNNIETLLEIDNPYDSAWRLNMFGYNTTTLKSNSTLASGSTGVFWVPIKNILHHSLVPIKKLCDRAVSIKAYINNDIRYTTTSNVNLTDLTISVHNLRVFYFDVDDYEYTQLVAPSRMLYNTLIRRLESWTITAQSANSSVAYPIQSTTGIAALAFFVWLSPNPVRTNSSIDTQNVSISNVTITNAGGTSIFGNNTNLTTTYGDLRLIPSLALGGSWVLENSNTNFFMLPPFAGDLTPEIFELNAHHSPYIIPASGNQHNIYLTVSSALSNVTLYLFTICAGYLCLDDNDGTIREFSATGQQ